MNTDSAGSYHADVARKLFGIVCIAAQRERRDRAGIRWDASLDAPTFANARDFRS